MTVFAPGFGDGVQRKGAVPLPLHPRGRSRSLASVGAPFRSGCRNAPAGHGRSEWCTNAHRWAPVRRVRRSGSHSKTRDDGRARRFRRDLAPCAPACSQDIRAQEGALETGTAKRCSNCRACACRVPHADAADCTRGGTGRSGVAARAGWRPAGSWFLVSACDACVHAARSARDAPAECAPARCLVPQVRVRSLDANLGGGTLALDCRRFLLPTSSPFNRRRQSPGVSKWDSPDSWKHHRLRGTEKT